MGTLRHYRPKYIFGKPILGVSLKYLAKLIMYVCSNPTPMYVNQKINVTDE